MRWLPPFLLALLLATSFGCRRPLQPAAESTSGDEYPPIAPDPAAAQPPSPEPLAAPAGPAAAQESELDAEPVALQLPPYVAIIIHDVKNYDAWRSGFDASADARKAASLVGESVMRGVDDANTVAVYVPATDLVKAQGYLAGRELAQEMKQAGVEGTPTVYVFKLVVAKMAMQPEGDVYGAIVRHDVKDFDAFKRALEAGDAARNRAGLIGWGVGQGADDPREAYVYLQSSDPKKLKAYLAAKKTQAAMKRAGAKGKGKTTIVQEISNRMYE